MKTNCHITDKILKDEKGNIHCQNVLLPHSAIYYVGYTCTINEIVNNLKVDENPEYPYFCLFPSSIDVQIPATVTLDEEGNLLAGKYRLSDRQQLAEGTSITIRKVRPILEAGALIWGTVLQYDLEKPAQKVEVQEEKNTKAPSIVDFNFVLDAGYKEIYAELEKAMKYYESDPEQSCMNFRHILKLTVLEVERITVFKTKAVSLHKRLKSIISFLIERKLINNAISQELWVIKTIGDKYHHKDDYPNLNPQKDRYTFYCAFQEVFKWFVALPDSYAAFIRAREEEKARLKAEKERLAREAKEREEAEKKALEELKKQEEAERKRLERNAKAREKRRLAREAKEIELKMAAKKAEEEAKAAEKEAKKQLRKIRWQKRVETAKKFLPWVGYGTTVAMSGIAAGMGLPAIVKALKSIKSSNSKDATESDIVARLFKMYQELTQ